MQIRSLLQVPKYTRKTKIARMQEAADDLVNIFESCPVPVFKNKSEAQQKKDVVQQLFNTIARIGLHSRGWDSEVPITMKNTLKCDFRKTFDNGLRLQAEIDFGNVASLHRDCDYFTISYYNKLIDGAVLVVPCYALAKRIDSGVVSYEKAVRWVETFGQKFDFPLLILGLDATDSREVDVSRYDLDIVKGTRKANRDAHVFLARKVLASA